MKTKPLDLLAGFPAASVRAELTEALTARAKPPAPWRNGPTNSGPTPLARPQRLQRRRVGRVYVRGRNTYTGRPGTWTSYMVRTVLAHTSVRDAEEAHRKSTEYSAKRLDFTWMEAKGYISWETLS